MKATAEQIRSEVLSTTKEDKIATINGLIKTINLSLEIGDMVHVETAKGYSIRLTKAIDDLAAHIAFEM